MNASRLWTIYVKELVDTLCEHALGNYRLLLNMAGELLSVAARRELDQLDEKLYLEVFAAGDKVAPEGKSRRSTRRRR